jgi:hypothetical protein
MRDGPRHDNGETQPELETNSQGQFARPNGVGGNGAPPELGLRFVFPALRPTTLVPGERPLVLGREGEAGAHLAGTEISRRHAALFRQADGALVIRDLESRNGIFVGGQRCAEAALGPGDVVRLGEWVAVVVGRHELEPTPGPRALPPTLHLGPMAMQVAARAHRVASTGLSVVLEGDTGTGKERFARAIHDWSGRKGAFIAINCAAVPESLAEAELFGYREGAFTGAVRANAGHFRTAHGGTLFLDEVTDMPLAVQAKLLRALEQKEILPVGESRPIPVDVRIIAATQIPLEQAAAEKRLRPDLHARLDGFTLRLPPLRERRVDLPSLFLHLLSRHGLPAPTLSPRLVEALCAYDWPLNVRELDFLAQRLALLHGHDPIFRRSHLPDRIRHFTRPRGESPAPLNVLHGGPSRPQLLAELTNAGGNLARASERLGISRQKAYRILGQDSPQRSKTARRPNT